MCREEEAAQPQSPLTTSNQHKFVSVRTKQRKPSLNELFIIGRRENTIDRSTSSGGADEPTTPAPAADKQDHGAEQQKNEEDFIIVFKYGGKAYRCSEKEKTILERQVKALDPSTFKMLLDDFQLEVYAVLDEPQEEAPAELSNTTKSGDDKKSEDEEEDSEQEEKEEEWEADEDVDDSFGKAENGNSGGNNKNRRRRRRRGKRRNAAAVATTTPQKNANEAVTTPQKKTVTQGVELGGRVWTKSPASPFTPSKRANRLAEKNNTMRDTMRKRMQLAYEEEVHKQHGGGGEGGPDDQKLVWKRERKAGSHLQPATIAARKNAA
jgi:hypothetical protein